MSETLKNINPSTQSLLSIYNAQIDAIVQSSSQLQNAMRADAIKRFEELQVPGFKDENYKYTRIDKAIAKAMECKVDTTAKCVGKSDAIPQVGELMLRFGKGKLCKSSDKLNNLGKGVILGSLKQIASEHSSLVEPYLNKLAKKSDDAFVALNAAMAADGFFLYVPKGVELTETISVLNVAKNLDGNLINQRNLIILEEGAKASILFNDFSSSNNHSTANYLTEYFVGDNAQLDVSTFQNHHEQGVLISSSFYELGESSDAHATVLSFNAGTIRNNLTVDLNGEHAEMSMNGASILDAHQHVDNFSSISHSVPNCQSNQLYKNVLDEEAKGVFAGQIHVVRDAQNTKAFQRNNNVLLSDKANVNAKPQLIIDADDVKCSHGATIGQIDEDALFYMRSRGIGEADARLMLMNAFCNEVIQDIRVEAVRDAAIELVERRLRKELSV